MSEKELNEPVLADDYPVYGSYTYVADGRVVVSDVFGTVRDLKHYLKVTEIRRCYLVTRAYNAKLKKART